MANYVVRSNVRESRAVGVGEGPGTDLGGALPLTAALVIYKPHQFADLMDGPVFKCYNSFKLFDLMQALRSRYCNPSQLLELRSERACN